MRPFERTLSTKWHTLAAANPRLSVSAPTTTPTRTLSTERKHPSNPTRRSRLRTSEGSTLRRRGHQPADRRRPLPPSSAQRRCIPSALRPHRLCLRAELARPLSASRTEATRCGSLTPEAASIRQICAYRFTSTCRLFRISYASGRLDAPSAPTRIPACNCRPFSSQFQTWMRSPHTWPSVLPTSPPPDESSNRAPGCRFGSCSSNGPLSLT